MRKRIRKGVRWLQRGNGDAVALSFVLLFVLICILYIAALMQYSYAMGNLNRAASVGARAAALCQDVDSANVRAREIADACINNPNVSNLETSIDPGEDGWQVGATAVLTLRADVRTLEPFFLSGIVEQQIVFTVETDGGTLGRATS